MQPANRLIFGRSPNALIGVFAIVFNAVVIILAAYAHVVTDSLVVGAINGAFAAIVLYIAGNDSTQVAAGDAALTRIMEKDGAEPFDPSQP